MQETPSNSFISLAEGDTITTAVETIRDEPLTIGGRTFQSRLMVGTGKYPDMESMVRAIEAAGAEVVTVAVRRVNLDRAKENSVLHYLDPKHVFLLANTAGCYTAAVYRSRPATGMGRTMYSFTSSGMVTVWLLAMPGNRPNAGVSEQI